MKRMTIAAIMCLVLMPAFGICPVVAQDNPVQIRGLVDIIGGDDADVRFLNTQNTDDSAFDPLRARLFIEGKQENTEVYIQFLFSPESRDVDRLYGAYVLHRIFDEKNLFFEIGRIPTHDGIWASTTYSNKNPLVGTPLGYYWKSSLPYRSMPNSLEELVASRLGGQRGVMYTDSTGAQRGTFGQATLLYDNCWNNGAYLLGSTDRLEFAAGVTTGTTGAPVNNNDTNENIALHAKVGAAVTHGLKLYLSAARGAYLGRDAAPYLAPGQSINEYFQTVYIASATWQWNYLTMSGEHMWNHYDTPLRADGLGSTSTWLQAVYTVAVGWDVALRYDEIRFEDVTTTQGTTTWDQNVYRWEGGISYKLSRHLIAKGVVQATDIGDGYKQGNILPTFQMSFSF